MQVINAINNWWGSIDGPHDVSTSTPTGTGDRVSENVLYVPFLTSDPLLTSQTIDPVIIIPGIMGSAYKNGNLVIDPILHTYDDLIATLEANGYKKEKNLFTFPYEWRDSNTLTAAFLRNKINQIQEICQCQKVDIVAHSMGGLVARQYIQSDNYGDDVDQLIFLGTPHKGSPKSYLTWEAGEFPPGFIDSVTKLLFGQEAEVRGFSSLFDYVRNRPISSAQELLPVFDYIKDKDTGITRTYPNNYPVNSFLENLNNSTDELLNSGVKITNIVGNSGNKTVEKIRVMPGTKSGLWQNGEPDGFYEDGGDNGLERGAGDNTVTTFGATLDTSISNKETNATHSRIPTVEENSVFKILTGKDSITNIDSGFQISPIVMLLQLESPIDFVITAPNGEKMGKNFGTGLEYNEIPYAFYSGYQTEDEYITILNPLNGEYKIEVQGTGSGGEYRVSTSYISDEFATTTETIGITQPNQITNLEVSVDNQNPGNLQTERKITLEVLINDINGAYNLGWIKDADTRDELLNKARKIFRNNKIDKNMAKLMLVGLKSYTKGKINQQAYNIIKEDLEWLINN